jgi:4-amino-4-deoxy-L-arabinose transferase-like glycosyltransferase
VNKIFKVKYFLVLILLVAAFLRLYKLSVNPPSLFGDELDLGYQAYSILTTGRDYQGNFLPIHFHSLAEWRTPLYLYSAVPTVAIFGITPLGVRLPAAIFGILSVYILYLFVRKISNNESLALTSSFLLAISPWSLQYSRAGFEVTLLLLLLILGLWLFIKSLTESKYLWLAVVCLVLTSWVYATAKLFTPLLLVFLFIVYQREIVSIKRSDKFKAVVAGFIVGTPIVLSTLFGGGTQRIGDISILTDPNMEQIVGAGRILDQKVGVPLIESKLINNKYIFFGNEFIDNYLKSFSTEFLFLKGDVNFRQSIGTGQLFLIEIIPLLVGIGLFFIGRDYNTKLKLLMGFWLLVGAIPSALTIGGGTHATRLILILPPLIFLISFGLFSIYKSLTSGWKGTYLCIVVLLYIVSMAFYFHRYYVDYPLNSERWWHYGWGPAISEIKKIDKDYNRVIISMSGEPAWIFFAGYYQYDPTMWQKEFPIGRDIEVSGFGKISYTGKFFFGSPANEIQIYGLGRYIDSKTLYLANANEIGNDLTLHPEGTPPGLKLIKTVLFPSGKPAFYLFSGEN